MILELLLAIIGVTCYYIMVFSSFPWPDSSSMTLGVRLVVRVGARLTVRLSSTLYSTLRLIPEGRLRSA